MTDLEKLLAIEDIKQLQGRRVRAVDSKDWVLYAACHSPNMAHDNDDKGGKISGLDVVIKRVKDSVEGAVTIHHVHSPEFEFTSDTTAKGIWVLEDRLYWKDRWQHGFGHYYDSYAKENGKWVFTSRKITRLRLEKGTIGA